MSFAARSRRLTLMTRLGLAFLLCLPAWAAEKNKFRVDDYQIDAELQPHTHRITARAKVKFTALSDNLNVATFELNNGLRVTKVTDEAGKPVEAERVTQDSAPKMLPWSVMATAGMPSSFTRWTSWSTPQAPSSME